MLSTSLLNASINKEKVKSIILVSSKEVVSKNLINLDKINKHPYAISKLFLEIIAKSYIKNFNLPIVIIKFDNIFGAGDLNFNRLIPALCKNIIFKKNKSTENRNDIYKGFIYIDDIIKAMELTVENFSKNFTKKIIYFNSKYYTQLRMLHI